MKLCEIELQQYKDYLDSSAEDKVFVYLKYNHDIDILDRVGYTILKEYIIKEQDIPDDEPLTEVALWYLDFDAPRLDIEDDMSDDEWLDMAIQSVLDKD